MTENCVAGLKKRKLCEEPWSRVNVLHSRWVRKKKRKKEEKQKRN